MFGPEVLALDLPTEAEKITTAIKTQVSASMKKRGAVVGMSGGIDSSLVAALCVRALGPERVQGLLMPERDSSAESAELGHLLGRSLGINVLVEDLAPALAAVGCYARQEEAIRQVFPAFGPGWRCKVTLPSILDADRLNVSQLTVLDPEGGQQTARMPAPVYLQLIAATNYKQRLRKVTEYYHADRLNFAVAGTPNRLEYDQGFFVKHGDGAADFKPIAHLYKTQVFALAEFLGVPEPIRRRTPTTDTFSLPQTQEEFYFSLPYDRMDLCLYAFNHQVSAAEAAPALDLTEAQVERVYRDIQAKRRVAHYLHLPPQLVEPID